MILSCHIVAGSLIGEHIDNPLIIVPVSIISHLIMDAIPHWDYIIFQLSTYQEWIKVGVDIGGGLLAAYLIIIFLRRKLKRQYSGKQLTVKNIKVLLGIFFAVILDGITVLYMKWNFIPAIITPITKFHQWVHFK